MCRVRCGGGVGQGRPVMTRGEQERHTTAHYDAQTITDGTAAVCSAESDLPGRGCGTAYGTRYIGRKKEGGRRVFT